MHERLLDSIKVGQQAKLKQHGGANFLKHELQASDVRLNCREGQKLVNKTKKYLSGDFRKALSHYDLKTDFILNEN